MNTTEDFLRSFPLLLRQGIFRKSSVDPGSPVSPIKKWDIRVRILVVEDEHKLGRALQEGLQSEQYGVALAHGPAKKASTWFRRNPSIW